MCPPPTLIKMKKIKISISHVNGNMQHLSDIYPVIETNTILNKTITGIGATYSEIKAPRNSIIIEPSKPVIYGKTHDPKHRGDNLLGVVEGICQDKIVDYIEESLRLGKYVKILTTPESFKKVLDAFDSLDIDICNDGYFILVDEIQKTIKDCDYRPDITFPMGLFFKCRDKAIVSATTPKRLSDMRYKDFQYIKIVPDFDYRKDLNLYTTNNVLQCARELLVNLKSDERSAFFFVNSTDMILSLMKQLGVEKESAVFCSNKSVNKLSGLRIAYEDWEVKRMARYNWMTSRFYSAFDIEIKEKPIVIMITDCYTADYTMIDPYMDAAQIVGRFRNGVKAIYHICNFNRWNPVKSKEQILEELRAMKKVYITLRTLANSASTNALRIAFKDAQALIPFTRFIGENGKIDPYKVDNYIDEESIMSLYSSWEKLLAAYNECGYFQVHHKSFLYKIGDFERLRIESKTATIKEKRKEIVAQLEQLGACETEAEQQYKRDLAFADPLIVEAYGLLGKEEIKHLRYSATKIKEAIIFKKHQLKACATDAIQLINTYFFPQRWYSARDIKKGLKAIFKKLDIPTPFSITSDTINDYFEAIEKRTAKARGFYLIAPRFNDILTKRK